VWTPVRLGVACAGIVAMLAISGCSGSDPKPDVTPPPVTVTVTATPSPTTTSPSPVESTTPVAPSQAAGIPTASPKPPASQDPHTLNASALITLATVDPDSGGLLLGGFVSGVAEDGGSCVYIVTPGSGNAFTIAKSGVANNGSTSCGSTTVPASRVPAGFYTVVLRYSDARGQVESDAVKVEVP
jgi:hypothetical protein